MKTEMRTFCNAYSAGLEPFSARLEDALAGMTGQETDPLLEQWRYRLQEASHRVGSLNDKIARQHAFLLIFGPLKSGKSTLMNAISGAYVSEVSSLPAYPALVYVRHGSDRAFSATTYAGEKIEFDSSQAMSDRISRGHEELARTILDVERSGESFDPQKHFPDAIRRMDVQTPAEALAESGSVLVDTPGLYTRMRFGYDAMTRDFRDTASCAIFVVKSDNLFFEKVFEEFNELLGHFSRIFLVVNIDSSKRDLSPDGSLTPSLESREPEAIIHAFESLAMSAPLREAYEKGNLSVYPIDLLKAASRELNHAVEPASEADNDTNEPEHDGFSRFLNDLTDYLNSSDYLREFIHDSLRTGDNLHSEVAEVCTGEAATKLGSDVAQWRTQLEEADTRLKALNDIEAIDWHNAFGEAQREKDRLLREYAGKDHDDLRQSLNDALDKWLDTDDTLKTLREEYLAPLVEKASREQTDTLRQQFRNKLNTRNGGAQLSSEASQAIDKAGIRIEGIASQLLETLSSELSANSPSLALAPQDIAVNRSLSDCVLLRNGKAVSERLFGSEGNAPIPAAIKHKRITGKHLSMLRDRISRLPETELPRIQEDYLSRYLDAYIDRLSESLKEKQDSLKSEWHQKRDRSQQQLDATRKLQEQFEQLARVNNEFGQTVARLREEFEVLEVEEPALDSDESNVEDFSGFSLSEEPLSLDDMESEQS